MIGHPRVYLDGEPLTHVELVEGSPSVTARRSGDELVLEVTPRLHAGQQVALVRSSPTRVALVFPSEMLASCGQILGEGIRVPAEQRARVAKLLDALSSVVAVQSDVGETSDTRKEVAANTR
jgi:hypothetical protein